MSRMITESLRSNWPSAEVRPQWLTRRMEPQRRLVFGDVAELYDRVRPSYPCALVDDILEFSGARAGAHALEIGAGTGKATRLFAERGLRILGLEPSAEMAGIARRNTADYEGVAIEQTEFEGWSPPGPF